MKKRCTNPSCRRYFTPRREDGTMICPYCGKRYAAHGLVRVELVGCVPMNRIGLYKALKSRYGLSLREARTLLDRLPSAPMLLGSWMPEEAARTAREWEKMGALVRLSEEGAVARKEKSPALFSVVMTGCAADRTVQAVHMAYRRLGDMKKARKAVRELHSRELVLAESLSQAEAQALADQAKERGVRVYIRWQRAG